MRRKRQRKRIMFAMRFSQCWFLVNRSRAPLAGNVQVVQPSSSANHPLAIQRYFYPSVDRTR